MFVNDGIFDKAVGMGQEYYGCIFLWPIYFAMASFWITFHTVLEVTTLGMYSQSTRGPDLFFLQVVKYFFYIRYFSKIMGKTA